MLLALAADGISLVFMVFLDAKAGVKTLITSILKPNRLLEAEHEPALDNLSNYFLEVTK
ncbi:hypothetical protein HCU01_19150 [Halomonas cupida]|uniref:Uncharacterized protein n=1 Tax=Halomonas cupida TaxID=44933 RepID=A0ABQ0WE98_9GAMM|nr:hypothetical protein HCU01_19150 [Halomonas cupida]